MYSQAVKHDGNDLIQDATAISCPRRGKRCVVHVCRYADLAIPGKMCLRWMTHGRSSDAGFYVIIRVPASVSDVEYVHLIEKACLLLFEPGTAVYMPRQASPIQIYSSV